MIACLFLALAGFPISRAVDRDAPLLRAIAEGFLLGTGLMTLVMLVVPWNRIAIVVVIAMVSAAFIRRTTIRIERVSPLALITLAMLIGYARYATAAPAWEVDFVADWGLKARVFFEHGGIDWAFLTNHWYQWSRQEYPPLVPFVYDFASLIGGTWDDRSPSIFYFFAVAATIVIIQSLLTDEFESPHVAAVAALAMAPLIATPWIGIGDTALIAFAVSGLLLIRRGSLTAGALLLGCAMLAKNEGYAITIATIVAIAITRGLRDALRLWPAVAAGAPWLIVRSLHHVGAELAAGNVAARFAMNVRQAGEIAHLLAQHAAGKPILWIGVILSLACAMRKWIERERLLLIVVALQTLAYIAAYLITPFGLEWHIRWSWDRIVWHIQPFVVFVALVTAIPLALTRPAASAESSS